MDFFIDVLYHLRMSERLEALKGVRSDTLYDVGKKGLTRVGWLERIWLLLSRTDSRRIERMQRFADTLLSENEHEPVRPGDYEKVKALYDKLKLKVSPELYALKAPFDSGEAELEPWVQLGREWKEAQACLDRREMSGSDIERIRKGASFAGFQELMQDSVIRHEFFNWTLRYRLPAELFICFPALRKKLSESYLHDQFASDEGANIRIDALARKAEVLFETDTWKNLLDKNTSISLGGIDFTMNKVLEDFAESQYSSQHLRYFPKLANPDPNHKREGICFWEKHKVMHTIDLSKEHFYEELPPVRRLTAQEVASGFDKPLNGKWIFGIAVARDTKTETFSGNHAFLIMGIPMKDGLYSFFPFGKLPTFYPKTFSEFIKLMFGVVPSEIIYPDDNIDRFEREHLIIPIVCDEATGMTALNKIKKDILKSANGSRTLFFQIAALNCCHWVEKLAKKVFDKLPDLFGIDFFDLKPAGFTGRIFDVIRPYKSFHPYLITPFVYFLSGETQHSGKKSYSILALAPWLKERGFFSASILFSRREKLELDITSFTKEVRKKDLPVWG